MKKNKKLTIKKEVVAKLSSQEMTNVKGGSVTLVVIGVTIGITGKVTKSDKSTNHEFTCGLCTGGN